MCCSMACQAFRYYNFLLAALTVLPSNSLNHAATSAGQRLERTHDWYLEAIA